MTKPSRSNRRTLALAGLLALVATGLPLGASAQECTGDAIAELVTGCSVLPSNEDLHLRLHGPASVDLSTNENIQEALNRAIVFVHGYSVAHTNLPRASFEDGSENVFQTLNSVGASVVVIAPGSSKLDRVEDDAQGLRAAIELLNQYRSEGAYPWVIFGHSMGGLMTRIALAQLEADGVEHRVALYISYDAPHTGVNVPQGMQNLKVKLDEWAAMTEDDFVAIDPGWKGVFSLAAMAGMTTALDPDAVEGVPDPTSIQAQQMTIQGVSAPDAYPQFMELLGQVGFPKVRKVTVTNGNTLGLPNTQTVGPGEALFYFSGAKGNSVASVRGTFEIFTDSPGATCFKSHVYYDGFRQNHDGGTKDATSPDSIVRMDRLSGGYLDYATQMYQAAEAVRGEFHNPAYSGASDSPIPFVPTSSALALPITTADGEIASIVARGETPFDHVYAIGDLPTFPSNIDHNTLVVPDALYDEIAGVLGLPGRPSPEPGGCVAAGRGQDSLLGLALVLLGLALRGPLRRAHPRSKR